MVTTVNNTGLCASEHTHFVHGAEPQTTSASRENSQLATLQTPGSNKGYIGKSRVAMCSEQAVGGATVHTTTMPRLRATRPQRGTGAIFPMFTWDSGTSPGVAGMQLEIFFFADF